MTDLSVLFSFFSIIFLSFVAAYMRNDLKLYIMPPSVLEGIIFFSTVYFDCLKFVVHYCQMEAV